VVRVCVLAAHTVVNKDVPDHSVVVGVPGRVVKNRVEAYEQAAIHREAVADMARKQRAAAEAVR
jgi:serine acetyltransferase